MVSVAPRDAASFVRSGHARYPIVLLHGQDAGLVAERAEQIALQFAAHERANILRMDGDEIAVDAGRLADEAYAITMFGGRRAIRVRAGARSFLPALQSLASQPPTDTIIVIEAGELRKTNPLRTYVEKAATAAALACYAEDARDVVVFAEEMASERSVELSAGAKQAIGSALGADRRRSRSELEKLFLYCHGQTRIDVDDVENILTDASSVTTDSVIDAAFLGEIGSVDEEARRNFADGLDPAVLLGLTLRHALLLRDLLEQLDNQTVSALVSSPRSGIHFRRQRAVAGQLGRWTQSRLDRAIRAIGDAVLICRREPRLAEATTIRTLWGLGLSGNKRDDGRS
jgi:DNA polymerase-3 subunit delta